MLDFPNADSIATCQTFFRTTIAMKDSTLVAVFVFGSFTLIFVFVANILPYKTKRLPLPPGPRTSWLGGTKLPKAHPWLTYTQWKDTFGFVQSTLIARSALTQSYLGDIIYIYTYGNPIVVLNTAEAADQLLDKRSNKYSSRPQRTMIYEL